MKKILYKIATSISSIKKAAAASMPTFSRAPAALISMPTFSRAPAALILTLTLALTFSSCQKENDPKKVTYFIKGFGSPYKVIYTYGEGSNTKVETITPHGISDTWSYSFSDIPGEITYIYVESKEDISASMSFNVSTLINGTTFQKALYYDRKKINGIDTVFYIKRSGTIPF